MFDVRLLGETNATPRSCPSPMLDRDRVAYLHRVTKTARTDRRTWKDTVMEIAMLTLAAENAAGHPRALDPR